MSVNQQARTDWAVFAMLLLATLAWDITGLDLALAHWYGAAQGFALRNDGLLQYWFHDVAQNMARAIFLGCVLMIAWPLGVFRHLTRADRVHLVLATLIATLLVVAAKQLSKTSCPWSLAEFGGIARYVSHWQWGEADGGGGRCFPGGHSSAGFAFVGAAFWLRTVAPRLGVSVWLSAGAAGLTLGWVQQMRGAHFFSHTLWAWVMCCGAGAGYFYAVQAWRRAKLVA
jgi:membrane-associated PAP2 superfamily phosphatase